MSAYKDALLEAIEQEAYFQSMREDPEKPKIFYLDDVVAKPFNYEDQAEKEFNLGKEMYYAGIKVPEPLDIITPDPYEDFSHYFLIFERIPGRPILHMNDKKQRSKALQQYRTELIKVLDFGLYPHDADWEENSLFHPREEQVYLIDLEHWEKESQKKIDAYKKELEKNFFRFRGRNGATYSLGI